MRVPIMQDLHLLEVLLCTVSVSEHTNKNLDVSLFDVEMLVGDTGKVAIIFHESEENKGASITNSITSVLLDYLRKSNLISFYENNIEKIRIFESYRYEDKAEISEIYFDCKVAIKYPNWVHCTVEEIIIWLNS